MCGKDHAISRGCEIVHKREMSEVGQIVIYSTKCVIMEWSMFGTALASTRLYLCELFNEFSGCLKISCGIYAAHKP